MTDTFHITLPKKFTYGDYSWFFEEARVAIEKADTLELNCHKVSYLYSAPSSYCDEVFRISNMYAHYVKRKPEATT